MKHLRIIDENGNKQDFETEHVPCIGECILLEFKRGSGPLQSHYYRVKDVMYRLDNKPEHQVAILIHEEGDPRWP